MSPTTAQKSASGLFIGVMAVLLILAIGFGGYESAKARQAEAALGTAREKYEAEQAQMRMLNGGAKAASDRIAELQAALAQQTSAASQANRPAANAANAAKVSKDGSAAQDAKAKALADGQEFLAAYGQSRQMLVDIGKAQIARNFSAFIRSGAVTPAQIDELETRTSEHWLQSMAVTPGSIHPTDPNLSDDELKGILGEQGFQQFQDYGRMQPLIGMVNDISSMSITAPLTAEQSTQLLNLLASTSSTYQSGGKANPQTVDWNQAMSQAQGILSEPQFNALKAEAQLPQVMDLVKQFYQARAPAK